MIYRFKRNCSCGSNEFKKEPLVLTSNPPMYVFSCIKCGKTVNLFEKSFKDYIYTDEAKRKYR